MSKRIIWIDVVKGAAILFVVLGHVLLAFSKSNAFPDSNNAITGAMKWIYLWHMPLFLFLSGLTFSLSAVTFDENGKSVVNNDKVKYRVKNWVLLYIIFELCLSLSKIAFSMFVENPPRLSDTLIDLLFPTNLLWYLWVIIAFTILFSQIIRMRVKPGIVFVILLIISCLVHEIDRQWPLRRCFEGLLCYAVYFYWGVQYGIAQKQNRKTIMENRSALIIAVTFIIIYSIVYCQSFERDLHVISGIAQMCMSFSMILVLVNCARLLTASHDFVVLTELSRASMVIYLLHTYFVTAIRNIVMRIGFSNALAVILVTWLVPVVLTWLIYRLSLSVAWIGYLFQPAGLIDRFKRKNKRM